jgi:endonuclease YncB( thermonuclease family)
MDSPTSLIRVFLRYAIDATPRFTIGCRTLPQEAMPVELQVKGVTAQTHGKDKYGRTLADMFFSDGTNVNHALVKDGWCWWYRKYAPGNTVLEGLKAEAREAKKDLWVNPAPVPAWEWRKRK